MQRRSMFSVGTPKEADTRIPATTSFVIDTKAKRLKERPDTGKMLSALRKVLADMSDRDDQGRRFYIHSNKVQVLKPPVGGPATKGEPRTYFGSGRFVMGAIGPVTEENPSGITTRYVEFVITFRDTKDQLGLPDVEYLEPTHVDDLTGTPVTMVDLS